MIVALLVCCLLVGLLASMVVINSVVMDAITHSSFVRFLVRDGLVLLF